MMRAPSVPHAPSFDPGRALVFALGVGVPVIVPLALGAPRFAVFAGVGAFTALMNDPRRSATVRAIAIALASIVIFAAAWIGLSLRLHPNVATAIALVLVLPIGLILITLPWLAMAAAAGVALFVAMQFAASRPVWAFITVLFVMHPQGVTMIKRLRARVAGTLAGVVLAGIVVHLTRSAWILAIVAIAAATAVPVAIARGFFASSAIVTLFVLVLLDISFLGVGGDTQLIVARLLDTFVDCGAVLLAVFALRRYRAWRGIEGEGDG